MFRLVYNSEMESANVQAAPFAVGQPKIRQAEEADVADILRLVEAASHVHMHADWSTVEDWLGQDLTALLVRNGVFRGFVAATLDPPPVAWLRVMAVEGISANYALRKMMEGLLPLVRVSGASQLACLAARNWVDDELPAVGFGRVGEIETWVKRSTEFPTVRSSDVVVRKVVSADFPRLAELDRAAFDNPLWWHSAVQLERGSRQAISFVVAEVGGTVVGYQFSTRGGSRAAHLVRITVHPDCQGLGLGHGLLAHGFREIQRLGIKKVSLNSQVGNEPAARLYRKFGFEPTGERFTVWGRDV